MIGNFTPFFHVRSRGFYLLTGTWECRCTDTETPRWGVSTFKNMRKKRLGFVKNLNAVEDQTG
jgi:hypothetical protein